MSHKTYKLTFPDGDAAERSFRCLEDVIDHIKEEFGESERVTIWREVTECHEIGTVENGVFTEATQEPAIEADPLLSELVDALDGILQWWMESDGGDDMPAALFDRAHATIAKVKGGAA